MKLRVPVAYDAKVIPKRARLDRDMRFGEWTEVEIREVADIEAPLALRWKDTEYHPKGVDGYCERRWFNGALWMPRIFDYSGKPNEHVDMDMLRRWTEQGWQYSPLVTAPDWQVRDVVDGKSKPLVEEDFRQVTSSGRKAAFDKLQSVTDSLICIDGMIWCRTHEPVYHASRSVGFYETYYKVDIVAPPAPDANQEGVFRADRFDDMAAWTLDKWGHEVDEESRITVLLPECLRYEDEMPSLLAALRDAVTSQADRIGEKDRATVISWVDMREAVNRLEESKDDATVADAVTAAEVWLHVADAYDFYKESLQAALDRWNSRPIAFDDGTRFSLDT